MYGPKPPLGSSRTASRLNTPSLQAPARGKPVAKPPAPAKLEPAAGCLAEMYELHGVPLHVSEGGRSELRLAVHKRTGQPAVVRAVALRPAPAVAPHTAVELWRRLDNRHVVGLYDSFETPTHAVVCMEAVHGLALDEVMQEHGLSGEEARAIFKQVRRRPREECGWRRLRARRGA